MHRTSKLYKIGKAIGFISQLTKVEGVFRNRISTSKTWIGGTLRNCLIDKTKTKKNYSTKKGLFEFQHNYILKGDYFLSNFELKTPKYFAVFGLSIQIVCISCVDAFGAKSSP